MFSNQITLSLTLSSFKMFDTSLEKHGANSLFCLPILHPHPPLSHLMFRNCCFSNLYQISDDLIKGISNESHI